MSKVLPDEKIHWNSLWGSLFAKSKTIKRSSATCNADGANGKAEDLGSLGKRRRYVNAMICKVLTTDNRQSVLHMPCHGQFWIPYKIRTLVISFSTLTFLSAWNGEFEL